MNPAAIATQVEDVQGDGRWMSQHNRFVMKAKEKEPEVVFIGDSLIRNLAGSEVWRKMFEPLHCFNFGIGGDQTQHVLWRVENGELDFMEPKVIVLLVGTNNYKHTAEQVVGGIMRIVEDICKRQPKAELIVMGLPPRGEKPNILREKIASINLGLGEQLPNIANVTYLPVDPCLFVNPADETISHNDMYDYIHLTARGYQKLVDPLLEIMQDLLQNFVKVENISMDSDSLAGDLATKAP